MDKVSIIVPIYNVEDYLRECIDSIIRQTYKNIEIILVEDGSPDNCGKICDEYAKKDNRIKVIHKKNGGISDARNCGIDIANGKYIAFIDSDDYVENTYIERLYNAIKLNNVLISQCNILKVNDNKEILERIGYSNNEIKSGKEMIYDIYYNNHWVDNVVVWNKMYDTNLFKKIRYPIGKIHEDEFVTYKVFYFLEKVAIVNDYLYNYRKNDRSITGKKFNLNVLDKLEAFEERMQFFIKNNDEELLKLTKIQYLKSIINIYCKLEETKDIENYSKVENFIIDNYRKNIKGVIRSKKINKKAKIKIILFYFSPKIYVKLKNIKNKVK